jgi:2,4-diketo-3-deoxy-L-fuconate hydrolase
MRLSAFDDGGVPTMAVVLGDRLSSLAPVETVYGDLDRWRAEAATRVAGSILRTAVREVPAVPRTAKVLCVGLNYHAHAAEGGRTAPALPNLFARWASTLVADGAEVPLPVGEPRLDYEAELAVVIGRRVHGIDPAEALDAVFAYACFDDITARGYQNATPQWALGKNPDRSGPIGNLVTADDVGDPQALAIGCRVNGELRQSSNTSLMIHSVASIIAYASGCLTLEPGDVIATGTPEGVGFRRTPPVFLGAGDVVTVEIERLGTLTSVVVARP